MKGIEHRFDRYIAIRIHKSDQLKLSEIAERLSLKRSEVSRRALRVGLQFFKNVDLPGGEEVELERKPL